MNLRILAALTTVACLAVSSVADATVVRRPPLEDLVEQASLVVRGTIVAQQLDAGTPSRRALWTLSEVRVQEVLKGRHEGPVLVRQPGGAADGLEQTVAGAASFRDGEDVVLFLEPAKDEAEVFVILGLSAGKYALSRSGTGEVRAVQDLTGLHVIEEQTLKSRNAAPVLRRLGKEDHGNAEAFLNRIRAVSRSARGVKP